MTKLADLPPRPSPWSFAEPKRSASYGEDDYKWRFRPDHPQGGFSTFGDVMAGADALLSLRKEALREREYWLAAKRDCGRFAKDMASEWMKTYRGVCLVIGWLFPGEYGDCPYIETYQWPEELHLYAGRAMSAAQAHGRGGG